MKPNKIKFKQRRGLNREQRKVPHPVFDNDEQVSQLIQSIFRKIIPFWPIDYVKDDKLLLPPIEVLWEASRSTGSMDNDIPSTFEFYLQNFYGHEPEDLMLAKLAKAVQTGHKMDAEELHYVAGYFLKEHSDGD